MTTPTEIEVGVEANGETSAPPPPTVAAEDPFRDLIQQECPSPEGCKFDDVTIARVARDAFHALLHLQHYLLQEALGPNYEQSPDSPFAAEIRQRAAIVHHVVNLGYPGGPLPLLAFITATQNALVASISPNVPEITEVAPSPTEGEQV